MATKNKGNTKDFKAAFMREFLRTHGNIAKSCTIVGISRQCYYENLKRDAKFRQDMKEAMEGLTDELEASALKRATYGVRKPIYYKGIKCGEVDEYPEQTAIFLLRNRRKAYRKADDPNAEKAKSAPNDVQINVTVDKGEKK